MKYSILSKNIIAVVIIGILTFPSCSPDPDKKANDLYLEASRIIQTIKRSELTYTETYAKYQEAKEKIEHLLTKYPSSYLAYNLRAEETAIVGLTLEEFRQAEKSLKRKAAAEKDPILCALLIAEAIKDNAARIMAMTAIAENQAAAGQKEKAIALLSRVFEDSKELENSSSKARALTEIARAYFKLGRMEDAERRLGLALKSAAAISAAEELAVTAAAYAEFGFFSQAADVAATIKDDYARVKALADIAGEYGKNGKHQDAGNLLSQALQITQAIQGNIQSWSLAEIAVGFAKTEEFNKALDTAAAIRDSNALAWTLAELSGISAAADEDTNRNEELMQKALESLDPSEDSPQNAWARAEIAAEYAAADQFTKALDLTKSITHDYSKNWALAAIAGQLAQAGKYTWALEISAGINDPYFQSRALAAIGQHGGNKEEFPGKKDIRILTDICRRI